jgi:hypothetical protein
VFDFIGEPGGTRTRDPMIKSHVLYRLSYGLSLHFNNVARYPAGQDTSASQPNRFREEASQHLA